VFILSDNEKFQHINTIKDNYFIPER
jgi:hypothetical protein